MFIAAPFTITKLWKQPRCPTVDEWIKKMWYLYTMKFYSAMKKNEILSFAGKSTHHQNWRKVQYRFCLEGRGFGGESRDRGRRESCPKQHIHM
jgi:hypothetical protein